MLKRTITGACYVAILTAFFLLRQFVDFRIFHLLTYFFAIVGTIEVARAVRPLTIKGSFFIAIALAVLFLPAYYLGQYVIMEDRGYLFVIYLIALALIITCFLAFFQDAQLESFLWTALQYVYPTLLLMFMLMLNDLNGNALVALLLAFTISPFSDTFAYFVGSMIGGKKLCPKLSPKKTWSGAIGGTIGGILASLLVYWIFAPSVAGISPFWFFFIIGLVASIVNIFGDLFESFIKRRVGIKDMGKIVPGHGGVMDRIDGTSFVVVVIYIAFMLV